MTSKLLPIHAVEAGNDPVAESHSGISCPPESPAAISAAIQQLMRTTPSEREAMGQRGRSYVILHHDYRVLAAQFLEAIKCK